LQFVFTKKVSMQPSARARSIEIRPTNTKLRWDSC
jgi:hypothetical protein